MLLIIIVVEIEEGLSFDKFQEISCPFFNMDIQSPKQAVFYTNIEKHPLAKHEELTLNGPVNKQKNHREK